MCRPSRGGVSDHISIGLHKSMTFLLHLTLKRDLTFKAVTKLRRDSVSPWRHTFLNSADSGRRFCLYFAETSCKFCPNELRNWPIQWNFFQGMPIINTSLQKGCTSYYMPEISKNEIAILKSNCGKKLIRIDSLHEDVQWISHVLQTKLLWTLQQRQSSWGAWRPSIWCSWICTIQYNKSLFSCSFIIFLMPTWIENMV